MVNWVLTRPLSSKDSPLLMGGTDYIQIKQVNQLYNIKQWCSFNLVTACLAFVSFHYHNESELILFQFVIIFYSKQLFFSHDFKSLLFLFYLKLPQINFNANILLWFMSGCSLTQFVRGIRRRFLRGGTLSSRIALRLCHTSEPPWILCLLSHVHPSHCSSDVVSMTVTIVSPSISAMAGVQWVLWKHWMNRWRDEWGFRAELRSSGRVPCRKNHHWVIHIEYGWGPGHWWGEEDGGLEVETGPTFEKSRRASWGIFSILNRTSFSAMHQSPQLFQVLQHITSIFCCRCPKAPHFA